MELGGTVSPHPRQGKGKASHVVWRRACRV